MSLMFAVGLYVNASLALLVLGFEFLALVNLLVYVGALAVLFLFVVMLLEIPTTELRAYHRGGSVLALLVALASRLVNIPSFGSSGVSFSTSPHSSLPLCSLLPSAESISAVGHAFYIRHADLLVLNSLVLTLALFGALVLAHTR
jgi:NADH:ubiquinone oxidoreductase subunit 6 (subunit J)